MQQFFDFGKSYDAKIEAFINFEYKSDNSTSFTAPTTSATIIGVYRFTITPYCGLEDKMFPQGRMLSERFNFNEQNPHS